jgi:hypothetical protein
MKRSLLLTAALTVLVLGVAGWVSQSYTFERSSKIWVEGTSTVHDWECQVVQFAGNVNAEAAEASLADISTTTLTVPVQGIDCDNGTMNGKVSDALGSSPVRYALTDATVGAPTAEGWFTIRTTGELSIAGNVQTVQMDVKGKALENGRFRLTGQHTLKMTDYGVDPPTAMFGTLKTGDEVTVHFDATIGR